MKLTKTNYIGLIVVGMFLAYLFIVTLQRPEKVLGSAPMGYQAKLSSTSEASWTAGAVGPLFASSTACVSRQISSSGGPLNLMFGDTAIAPDSNTGFTTTASTTVLDSGIFGCGLVRAYAVNATQITITEWTDFK